MTRINKDPVKLRERRTRTGAVSLYLDIYAAGVRRYEYLHLYLLPGTTKEIKDKNRETMRLAEAIRARRAMEFINGRHGFTGGDDVDFLSFFTALTEERDKNWHTALRLVGEFQKKPVTVGDIDAAWVERWQDFLRGRSLMESTALCYHKKVVAALNLAVRKGIIPYNPCNRVRNGFKPQNKAREYLTAAELQKLFKTKKKTILQRAFLFSCLTGLRVSDISALTWGKVTEQGGMCRIVFRQKKTGGQEYLDINGQAAALMGERGKDGESVFGDIVLSGRRSEMLRHWAASIGINKHITFHSGRHTFAVLMLDLGVDIYTVCKLLGHTDIKTTQIYAKILDKNKREAVGKIPDFGGE